MGFAECATLLLLVVSVLANSFAIQKVAEDVEERVTEIGYLFDWIAEVQRKTDKLDAIVQEIENE